MRCNQTKWAEVLRSPPTHGPADCDGNSSSRRCFFLIVSYVSFAPLGVIYRPLFDLVCNLPPGHFISSHGAATAVTSQSPGLNAGQLRVLGPPLPLVDLLGLLYLMTSNWAHRAKPLQLNAFLIPTNALITVSAGFGAWIACTRASGRWFWSDPITLAQIVGPPAARWAAVFVCHPVGRSRRQPDLLATL